MYTECPYSEYWKIFEIDLIFYCIIDKRRIWLFFLTIKYPKETDSNNKTNRTALIFLHFINDYRCINYQIQIVIFYKPVRPRHQNSNVIIWSNNKRSDIKVFVQSIYSVIICALCHFQQYLGHIFSLFYWCRKPEWRENRTLTNSII